MLFAYTSRSTRVGCAIEWSNGGVSSGANVEGPFATSVHAEIAAILGGIQTHKIRRVAIASNRERFTPCGACRDWLRYFGSDDTIVDVSGYRAFRLGDLHPEYPY